MTVGERGDRWPADAVVALLAGQVPELPELFPVRGRDGSRMYGMTVNSGDYNRLWQSLRAVCAPHGWWPVVTALDPVQVATPPRLLTQPPEQVLAEAEADLPGSIFTEMIASQAWAMDFGDWWDGPDDQVPSLRDLAGHVDDPSRA